MYKLIDFKLFIIAKYSGKNYVTNKLNEKNSIVSELPPFTSFLYEA